MSESLSSEHVEQAESESVLYTRGLGSPVYAERDSEVLIGHVALIDCDESDAIAAHTLAESMDGYVALFQSSPGSFHLWSLSPRPLSEAVMDALAIRIADTEHVAQSRRRESFVLRAAPKVYEGGETYKDAPELLAVYDDGEGAVARGHHAVVVERGGEPVEEDRLVGAEQIETHSYMTVTDAAKEALR